MLGEANAFSSFAVDDVDRAQAFYAETLGVEVEPIPEPGLLQLKLAGGHTVMIYPKPDFEPATYTVLNFTVEDIDAAVDALAGRGVEFERYDGFDQDEKGIARGQGGPPIAWFKDPAGNIISVLQPPS